MLFLEQNSKNVGKYWMQLYIGLVWSLKMFVLCLDKINIYNITQKKSRKVKEERFKKQKDKYNSPQPIFFKWLQDTIKMLINQNIQDGGNFTEECPHHLKTRIFKKRVMLLLVILQFCKMWVNIEICVAYWQFDQKYLC